MSIAIIAFAASLVIILFVLVQKWITIAEMVFLYFIVGILTVTLFTIMDVNLQWVPVTRKIEKGLALHICRFVIIPLLFIMAAGFLNSPLKVRWKFLLATVIFALLMVDDWLMRHFDLIFFRKWSVAYTIPMYLSFMITLTLIDRWFRHLDRGEVNQT